MRSYCAHGTIAPLVGLLLLMASYSEAFVTPTPSQARARLMISADVSRRSHSAAFWSRPRLPAARAGRDRSSSGGLRPRMQDAPAAAALETIEDAQTVIVRAAETRDVDPDTVIEAIRLIEKSGGSKKPLEGRDSSQPKFDLLTDNGNWRLIFTTGDVKTQKKLGGKISYVPIKAVQVFNPDYTITNGVYLGSFPVLKFSGTFTWAEEKARLEFTFNEVGVLGLNFPYNQGESKVPPGFTFMDISDRYVIARGAGGGLALWLRQDTV
ncbi:unnamed protein product [Ectocarpus sp. 6 AP-2014]